MTWLCQGFAGGETRDALIDGCAAPSSEAPITKGGLTIITSPTPVTGTGALQAAAGADVSAHLLGAAAVNSGRILCQQAWVNYDGNPSAAYYIMTVRNATYHYGYALQVGTDRRVRVMKEAPGTYTPITSWSEAVTGNGAWTHLVWFLDPLTLGTEHTWMTVLIDNVAQIQADVGTWPATLNGSAPCAGYLGGVAAANVNLRLDDIAGLYTTNPQDAPHITAAPIVKVAAQHPNSDTDCELDWLRVPASGTWFSKWADATGNDGDTTYLHYTSARNQSSDFESAADLGWGGSAVVLEYATGYGPVWSAIHKVAGSGTKWYSATYCSLAQNNTVLMPGATYEGVLWRLLRTSGSWAPADLGALKAGAWRGDSDKDWLITTLMLQWAYYDTTFALTPTPMIPQGQIF